MQFVVFIGVGWGILFFMHLLVYETVARVFSLNYSLALPILGLLAFSYFLASLGVKKLNGFVTDWFYYISATWLGVVLLLFSVVLPYELWHLVSGFESVSFLSGLLLLGVGLSAYALWQGSHLVTKEYELPIAGLTETIRLVHLSDIHIGTVHQANFLRRVVKLSNSLQPDLVLISGDLFDGSAPIDEHILKPLDDLMVPSFFSNGNHEEYEGLTYVRDTIKDLKLQLLENQLVVYKGLQIIGVNDRQSLPRGTRLADVLRTLPIDINLPTVLMYHTPVEWEAARQAGVNLMLSGHTHNGQIYPFNFLVKLFFKYIRGLYQEDGKYLHVTPGTGTWGPPMRLGSKNQVTLLKLVPPK